MRIIAGQYKGRKIESPKGMKVRPTSSRLRETLFNICQFDIEGVRFLDLFAGSGAMGFEALSRGAKEATFVDKETKWVNKNLDFLSLENAKVVRADVLTALERMRGEFDVIYADPPYLKGLGLKVLKKIDQSSLLVDGGMLFIEEEKGSDLESVEVQTLDFVKMRPVGRSILYQWSKK